MYISQFFIFASDSSLILVREYRDDVVDKTKDIIAREIMAQEAVFSKPYLLTTNKVHCFIIKRENLYFCATTTASCEDKTFVYEMLTKFADVVQDFCGSVNEKVLRTNVLLVYEILEEFLVDGYLQVDSTEKMKPLIFNTPLSNNTRFNNNDIFGINSNSDLLAPSCASDQPIVRQRSEQSTANRKREIFLDFVENLAVTVEKDGSLSKNEMVGRLSMKCFLAGSHIISMTFNRDVLDLLQSTKETLNFHDSVKWNRSDKKKISFPSPDGEVVLMRYRLERNAVKKLPFALECDVRSDDASSRDLNLRLKVVSDLPSSTSEVSKLTITIPVPQCTTGITQQLSSSFQSARLDEESKQVVWKLKKIPDKFEIMAVFRLMNSIGDESSAQQSINRVGPASLEFEMSGHLVSGISIGSLVVDDPSDAGTMRWIRYIVSSDCYLVNL